MLDRLDEDSSNTERWPKTLGLEFRYHPGRRNFPSLIKSIVSQRQLTLFNGNF